MEEEKLSSKDWDLIKERDGMVVDISCSGHICSNWTTLLFDNTGVVRGQLSHKSDFITSHKSDFVMLNAFVNQVKYINGVKKESIAHIWGCPCCKSLTYTNCIIEYGQIDNMEFTKVISVE